MRPCQKNIRHIPTGNQKQGCRCRCHWWTTARPHWQLYAKCGGPVPGPKRGHRCGAQAVGNSASAMGGATDPSARAQAAASQSDAAKAWLSKVGDRVGPLRKQPPPVALAGRRQARRGPKPPRWHTRLRDLERRALRAATEGAPVCADGRRGRRRAPALGRHGCLSWSPQTRSARRCRSPLETAA